jgi:hypothetical protein
MKRHVGKLQPKKQCIDLFRFQLELPLPSKGGLWQLGSV